MTNFKYINFKKDEKKSSRKKDVHSDSITRKDLLNIGFDPNQYLSKEKNEILIKDILTAAKKDKQNFENMFNKELFYTCKILDAYNKKNKELYYVSEYEAAN